MRVFIPLMAILTCMIILEGADHARAQAPNSNPFASPLPPAGNGFNSSNFVRPQLPQQQNNFVYRPQPNLQQPTTSPYLGLLRRGSTMGLNYYSIVRPEIQMRDALTRQQAEQDRLAQENRLLQQQQKSLTMDPRTQPGADPITGASRTMPPTGHSTSLLNLQGRFMTR
ncbi:MAG: hypothetical protein K8T91_21300 [Planctomycetes bacterium]|nr:hypothetical protein [Planctomycetota bacterium]